MEILEHGDTYKTTTCPKCHAYLSYIANDIEIFDSFDDVFGANITIGHKFLNVLNVEKRLFLKKSVIKE